MATGAETGRSNPQPIPQPSHRGAPTPNVGSAVSPPSRRELASWWKKFRKTTEKDEEKVNQLPGIFGVPLSESIRYANVAISLTNEQGESFIYGYVPIVVAKCGVFLKEKATDVEGIFRLSGSAKRIKELQTVFNSPDRYGKGLDWTGYTVHDAANILRRYLNQLPEPIVPLEQYERFRDPLRALQQRLTRLPEGQAAPELSATEYNTAVSAYQKLITELPALNRQLLLYILDLLAVFSSKSDLNRMTAANLAAIFQPGIISHPDHDMAPQEYRLSQDVLIFLIEHQDNFLIGMSGTGMDEKTQKEVESGAPSAKSPKTNIGRSASNASAGADSLRKYGIRRNVSTSSHASRERTSPNVSSPGTPASPSYAPGAGSIGVTRSNTVPSKRSPAVGPHRFQRVADSSSPNSPVAAQSPIEERVNTSIQERNVSTISSPIIPERDSSARYPTSPRASEPTTVPFPDVVGQSTEPQATTQTPPVANLQVPKPPPASSSQTRERKISSLFSKSPIFGPSDPQNQSGRQPRKLQKRQRLPGTSIESAQSSAASLQGEDPFHTPLVSPDAHHSNIDPMGNASITTPTTAIHPNALHGNNMDLAPPQAQDIHGRGSMAQRSPAGSLRSGTSMTETSDFDALDDPAVKAEKKQSRWRFSSSARKNDDSPLVPPPPIGQLPGARTSNSSLGSAGRNRPSFTAESHPAHQVPIESSSTGQPSVVGQISHDSSEQTKESVTESEKKGLFGKWKAKMAQAKEERREREAEKERAKSPQRMNDDNTSSRQSLSAFTHDHFSPRGRSFDKSRDETLPAVNEQTKVENARVSVSSSIASTSAAPQPLPQSVTLQPASTAVPATPSTILPIHATPPVASSVTSAEPLVRATDSSVLASTGSAAVNTSMPTVEEEARLELNTQPGQVSAPDSLQHTPTEIKPQPFQG